jgi:hypothetical protein
VPQDRARRVLDRAACEAEFGPEQLVLACGGREERRPGLWPARDRPELGLPSWPASRASAGTSSPGLPISHSTEQTGGSALNQ